MVLGDRLRLVREAKHLSLTHLEERTSLPQSYLLRVENGHEVPDIDTLDKWAAALQVPVSQLFYDGEHPPVLQNLPDRLTADDIVWPRLRKLMGLFAKCL